MDDFKDYELSTQRYDWSVKAFSVAKKLLKVNIKLHDKNNYSSSGQIFLFNHFSRFETFIPQYLIHKTTGEYCRSIASPEFFNDDLFADYLKSVGVIPSDLPHLFSFMVKEIMHGRKLILFPEGGMVKDKRVIDDSGDFNIYSRMALERRKQHKGAAVIGLAVDTLKSTLLNDYSKGKYDLIEHWAEQLNFEHIDPLMLMSLKPTQIIPANITFYPIRSDSNYLSKLVHSFNDSLSGRLSEELLIESNLLLKQTDMDIHYGKVINLNNYWKPWEKWVLPHVIHQCASLDDLFERNPKTFNLATRIHSVAMQRKAIKVRDDYMKSMYQAVSIHLSHIASRLICLLYQQGLTRIKRSVFHKMLYLSIKFIQPLSDIYCHRSLRNPAEYGVLLEGGSGRLKRFLQTVKSHSLVQVEDDYYTLDHNIAKHHDFDEVRTHNMISIYNNEVAPLKTVTDKVLEVVKTHQSYSNQQLAQLRYEDQHLAYQWDKQCYDKPRYAEINQQQTITEDANWFFLKAQENAPAVLLTHGLLASPAELKSLAHKLHRQGYHVLGVRLKGHGTSPWDLKNTTWNDWLMSVNRGYQIISQFSQNIHLLGFSTGALLSLLIAEKYSSNIQSVTAVSAPIELQDKYLIFIPLLQRANKITRWISKKGIYPFQENISEHPHINYNHIPIQSIHQLQKLISKIKKKTFTLACPIHLMHGDQDPVVKPESLELLSKQLNSSALQKTLVKSEKHGIIFDDIDQTQQKIIDWIKHLK